jgi:hypothetical protein
MEVNDDLHPPAALPPGKELPVSAGYESGWVSRVGMDDVEEKIYYPCGQLNSESWAIQPLSLLNVFKIILQS